jgi:hypothetical protein
MLAGLLWPHVRLILLHVALYVPLSRKVRRLVTMVVANLGKWALTVVIVLLTGLLDVFTIEGTQTYVELWQSVDGDVHYVCEAFCHNWGNVSTLANCTDVCDALDPIADLVPTELQGSATYGLDATPLSSLVWFCVGTLLSIFCDMALIELEKSLPGSRHHLCPQTDLVPPPLLAPPPPPDKDPAARPKLSATTSEPVAPPEWGLSDGTDLAPALSPRTARRLRRAQSLGGGSHGLSVEEDSLLPELCGMRCWFWPRRDPLCEQLRAPLLPRRARAIVSVLLVVQLGLTAAAISTPFMSRAIDGSLIELIQRMGAGAPLEGKLYGEFSLWHIGKDAIDVGEAGKGGSSLFMGVCFMIYLVPPSESRIRTLLDHAPLRCYPPNPRGCRGY